MFKNGQSTSKTMNRLCKATSKKRPQGFHGARSRASLGSVKSLGKGKYEGTLPTPRVFLEAIHGRIRRLIALMFLFKVRGYADFAKTCFCRPPS